MRSVMASIDPTVASPASPRLPATFSELAPYAVEISVGFVALLTIVNLRGVRESGRAFAIPTYGFVASILLLLAVGFAWVLFGDGLSAESAAYEIKQDTEAVGAPRDLPGAPRICIGLHGSDRRRSRLQRNPRLSTPEETQTPRPPC